MLQARLWELAAAQHGVVSRAQLLALGWTPEAIRHLVRTQRLHPFWRGVYAVGRPELSREGRWLAAVIACGAEGVLSHGSAAALWQIGEFERVSIEVSLPIDVVRRHPGIRTYRRRHLAAPDLTTHAGIPVTDPIRTIIDLACRLGKAHLELAINEAANLELVTPPALRAALDGRGRQPGVARLRRILDARTFRLTRSVLERRFLPIARAAGLPTPLTREEVNAWEVDFYWPALSLVVETDGLRYHRTPAQQARDRLRDQAHAAAGLTALRFTHAQVAYEPGCVEGILRSVANRLREGSAAP